MKRTDGFLDAAWMAIENRRKREAEAEAVAKEAAAKAELDAKEAADAAAKEAAKIANGRRILAEIAAAKVASAPPARKRSPEERAALVAEFDRNQEAFDLAEMARGSVHGFGRNDYRKDK